jgi:hypothetical protein
MLFSIIKAFSVPSVGYHSCRHRSGYCGLLPIKRQGRVKTAVVAFQHPRLDRESAPCGAYRLVTVVQQSLRSVVESATAASSLVFTTTHSSSSMSPTLSSSLTASAAVVSKHAPWHLTPKMTHSCFESIASTLNTSEKCPLLNVVFELLNVATVDFR